jgi:hypothetical protein
VKWRESEVGVDDGVMIVLHQEKMGLRTVGIMRMKSMDIDINRMDS